MTKFEWLTSTNKKFLIFLLNNAKGGNIVDNLNTNVRNGKSGQCKIEFSNLSSLSPEMLSWVEKYNNGIIILLNLRGELLYISNSVERILGYKVADLIGMKWHEIISPEDATNINNNFDRKASINQTFNINILNSDEKYVWTEWTVKRMKEQTNNQYLYISSLIDITDRKEAEEMMVRSEKMSVAGQLAAGIAHEIRNPLTSLKGFLQLLQAGINRKEAYYNIMIEEIEKMETITSELLFIAKPLTDQKKQESVNNMIEDIVTLLQPQAKINQIEIIFNRSNDVQIYCDRSQIKQVLINLVKNAIEAMEEAGKIEIDIQLKQEYVEIKIMDEGPGVPEEIVHKLGEPFFTTKKTGTGLGIMVSKQILEQHQSTLEIKNNNEKGSVFQIIFPINAK